MSWMGDRCKRAAWSLDRSTLNAPLLWSLPASSGRVGCIFQGFRGALLMPAIKPDARRVTCLPSRLKGTSRKNGPHVSLRTTQRVEWKVEVELVFSVSGVTPSNVTKSRAYFSFVGVELSACLLETSGQASEERLQPHKYPLPAPRKLLPPSSWGRGKVAALSRKISATVKLLSVAKLIRAPALAP